MGDTLPFLVEYAKSGRASCQACKSSIEKDSLRIAKVVQSPFHDGTITKWFHSQCFFTKQRPKSTADIAHFDDVRWEHQQEMKKKIEEYAGSAPAASGKGKKRGASSGAFKDYTVEYAKSNRSVCVGCEGPIVKGDVRISKKDFESEKGVMFNGIDRWHHTECFAKLRSELGFHESGLLLPGVTSLKDEDRKAIEKSLPKMKNSDIPASKKMKTEPEDPAEEAQLKRENEKIFKMRDQLKSLSKSVVHDLLRSNKQNISKEPSLSDTLDMLADAMVFGALEPCDKCSGQFKYVSGLGYKCTGDLTEWTKCEQITQDPKRVKFVVSKELKKSATFLESYRCKVARRLIRVTAPSSASSSVVKKEEKKDADGPKIKGKNMPLKGMQFVILSSKGKKEDLRRSIMTLGGTVIGKMHENTAAVISTPEHVAKGGSKIEEARDLDIHVISEDFVEDAKDYKDSPISLISVKSICDWGGDPSVRVANTITKSSSHGKSVYEKSSSGKIKLRVKGGGAVDPESGLEDVAHIYQEDKDKYTATLGITDIQAKKNSYYKMQILKHDKHRKYWLFRSWGRIGTKIGNTKLEELGLKECLGKFNRLYEEKTGNHWEDRHEFVKKPGRLYPIDTDHGPPPDSSIGNMDSSVASKLRKPVQELVKLIFDVDSMRKVMLEFELDTDKMPLGKLSQKQLQSAYAVLNELQQMIKNGGTAERSKLIDASNRFYTLVPHSFGVNDPVVLQSEEEIKAKCEMIESLLEMEIAYNMLNVESDETKNPVDIHYGQLNTDIDVLDEKSKEFEIIEQYVRNTHASTHTQYDLEIEQVFHIKRQGEDQRYKPFKKLPNRKLLWHGSRTTNFAGILSQGLRIAPPEAPVTGYMFGKGIYFADMVSKSANYCCTNSQNSTGLLLLCEVALGNMYERLNADYIEKLPKGKHSTMGCGKTHPDPSVVHVTDDGVEIPYGPGVPAKLKEPSSLLYNEYIVYDVAQVKAKYLLRVNFKYKY